ncbi:MAG: M24 family metallopeptidase [Pseudomonadota bacterium]
MAKAPFTPAEYDRRLALTRAAMEALGIELLLVSDPSNMAWLTGYDGWSFYVHQGLVLGLGGDPLWWGRAQDAQGALRTVWMAPDCVAPYDERYVQSAEIHPMEDLAGQLAARAAPPARIGVEMDNYYYSARAHAVLAEALGADRLVDATGLVNRQRTVKSAEELAVMRKAAAITDHIVTLAIERAEPGVPKNHLVAEIAAASYRGVEGVWGDYPAIVPLLPSGSDAAASHLTWDGRPLRSGEATFFELSGCHHRYHVPLCRTVFLGTPPPAFAAAAEALVEGVEAGLERARAGNRACDIAEALNAALAKAGIERKARAGYPVGLSYPPDWGERTISIRPEDTTVLEPGMTFHFMPGLWMEHWGIEITETILIRENGPAEPLCSIPRQLFVKS